MSGHNPSKTLITSGTTQVPALVSLLAGAVTNVNVTFETPMPDANWDPAPTYPGISAAILSGTTRTVVNKTATGCTVRFTNNGLLALNLAFTVCVVATKNA